MADRPAPSAPDLDGPFSGRRLGEGHRTSEAPAGPVSSIPPPTRPSNTLPPSLATPAVATPSPFAEALAASRSNVRSAGIGATLTSGRSVRAAEADPNAQRIGGHRVLRSLGKGPLCHAYEVEGAKGAGRGVLRLLLPPAAENERARTQFVRAAYAANRVQHPRVLGVSEDGLHEGAPFVVRPHVEGEPLTDLVARQGKLHEQQALVVAEQLLDVIEIAHSHGVVHGGVAPGNVLVTARGSTRLCDFAVPPSLRGQVDEEPDALARFHVSTWTAPERCIENPPPASEAGDIYAIAATMFFMVTGEAPRGPATDAPTLSIVPARKVKDLAPTAGDAFAAVIDHALSALPSRRYESAYAMLGDVRRVLARRPPKLGEARQPNPSGSYSGMRVPLSMARPPSASPHSSSTGEALMPSSRRGSSRRVPWRGNVMLILAIALLVGVATFVVVRERVDEERNPDHAGAQTDELR